MQKDVNEVQLEDVDFGSATIEFFAMDKFSKMTGSDLVKTLKEYNIKFVRDVRHGTDSYGWFLSGKKTDLYQWLTGPGGIDEDDIEDVYEELFESESDVVTIKIDLNDEKEPGFQRLLKYYHVNVTSGTNKSHPYECKMTGKRKDIKALLKKIDYEDVDADLYPELFESEEVNLAKINKIAESISLISGVSRIPAPLNAKFLTLGEAELAAAQFYATVSTWAAARGLPGLEKWSMAESGEEFTHYQDVIGFLNSMFGENINPVAAADLVQPIVRTDSLEEVMNQAYEFEKRIEEAYKAALNLAGEVKDATSENWLADKYKAQVGATQAALEMLNKVRNIVSGDGLVFFDAALAEGSPTAG